MADRIILENLKSIVRLFAYLCFTRLRDNFMLFISNFYKIKQLKYWTGLEEA